MKRVILGRNVVGVFIGVILGASCAELRAQGLKPPVLPTAEEAREKLRGSWEAYFAAYHTQSDPLLEGTSSLAEASFSAPRRRSLARAAVNPFRAPDELKSQAGELKTTLVVDYAVNQIGADPVRLRSYNGGLVGPTLRVDPGDTLRVTLRNDLPAESPHTGGHNGHHGWNTTNLHTHGLHVSPSGNSDNVLLKVPPGATQAYEIKIPNDHESGTFWYHAHKHGSTAAQVSSGMAGALIVSGGLDEVAEIKAAREQVMVLQQVPYWKDENMAIGDIEIGRADEMFGPPAWDTLGRFTTVNGVVLPVIEMRPGEVQRWRMIHSGNRESLLLKLDRSEDSDPSAPAELALHEIAVDGLPLGKIVSRDVVELWPGYRSDVLVKAPAVDGAEYLLVDERTEAADSSMNGRPESRKYVAKIRVSGTPVSMALPANSSLASYRIPSIDPSTVNAAESVSYGIFAPPLKFAVNGDPYNPTQRRVLTLGDVAEWTATSNNIINGQPIPIAHPFHIHVNPFEVFSIKDGAGAERLTDGPVWRDTIILKQDWTVKFRTRYQRFTGEFVNHCHILDHEDNGMMELVEIVEKSPTPDVDLAAATEATPSQPAPAGSLKPAAIVNAEGAFGESDGRPTVALFVVGLGCRHCSEQLGEIAARAETFERLGVNVVGISSQPVVDSKSDTANPAFALPFPVLSDPELKLFRRFGCVEGDKALHGTFVLDRKSGVRWSDVGEQPFMDIAEIALQADRVADVVEIEVRETETTDDDYLTWAPTACRARIAPGVVRTEALAVTLSNDPQQPVPADRDQPLDGDLAFAETLLAGETATSDSLALSLPADGSWVPFFVAGKFPRASTEDKDAVIEIHSGDQTGDVIGSHPLMVRVRKPIHRLTETERDEFLEALADLHMNEDAFERFVEYHRLAAVNNGWRDQAHRGPAFITWHRVFLLELERALQENYPHVALPYWIQGTPQDFFSPEFLGETNLTSGRVEFDTLNPLKGWFIDLAKDPEPSGGPQLMGEVERSTRNHNIPPGIVQFVQWSSFESTPDYRSLIPSLLGFTSNFDRIGIANPASSVEVNPHNYGHGWVGAPDRWMSNCRESPADPVFWVFHCNHDYLWAKWQWYRDRFKTSPDPLHFWPADKYQAGDQVPMGHHLKDTMWPWDGSGGPGFPNDLSSVRPPNDGAYFPFKKAPAPKLWPAAAASPTPADTIDYLGMDADRLEHGFCYEDVPYGARVVVEPLVVDVTEGAEADASRAGELAAKSFLDAGASVETRELAKQLLDAAGVKANASEFMGLVGDAEAPPSLRGDALDLLTLADPAEARKVATAVLDSPTSPPSLGVKAVQALGRWRHFSPMSDEERKRVHATIREAAISSTQPEVRAEALPFLAAMGDPQGEKLLVEFFGNPAASPLPPDAVVSLLGKYPRQHARLRASLASNNPDVVVAALHALSGDRGSEEKRAGIAASRQTGEPVRLAAIGSLMHRSERGGRLFAQLFENATEDLRIREEAGAALRVWIARNGSHLPESAAESPQPRSAPKRLGSGGRLARLQALIDESLVRAAQKN